MRNRYPGKCYVCGEYVPSYGGYFERRPNKKGWRVQHYWHTKDYRISVRAGTEWRWDFMKKKYNDHKHVLEKGLKKLLTPSP